MHRHLRRRAVAQRLGRRFLGLVGGDEAVVEHALDDVLLALGGPLRIDDGVVGRRRLGQAGQHGGFGHRHLAQRLAEVDLAGGGKAVGPLPQVDLVHVQLQDLVLAELPLDLQRQQDLVDLAGEGLFGGQVEVARHLHGDGGGALALGLIELGHAGAQHAQVVHAAVLVEARVFDGQHRVLHHLGHLGDGHEVAALFAVLAQQHVVAGVDAHRQLGPIVGQAADLGQVGVGHRQRDGQQHRHRDGAGRHDAEQPRGDAAERRSPAGTRRRGRRGGAGRAGRRRRRLAVGLGHEGFRGREQPIIESRVARGAAVHGCRPPFVKTLSLGLDPLQEGRCPQGSSAGFTALFRSCTKALLLAFK